MASGDRADRRPRKIISCGGTWLNKCGRVSILIKARRRRCPARPEWPDDEGICSGSATRRRQQPSMARSLGIHISGVQHVHTAQQSACQQSPAMPGMASMVTVAAEGVGQPGERLVHIPNSGKMHKASNRSRPMQQYTQPWSCHLPPKRSAAASPVMAGKASNGYLGGGAMRPGNAHLGKLQWQPQNIHDDARQPTADSSPESGRCSPPTPARGTSKQ